MHTNSTPNFNLPQFIASDTPAWLTDVNQAMSAIDTAMQANKTAAADAASTAAGASSKADTASSAAATATTVANNAANTATEAQTNANYANTKINNLNVYQSITITPESGFTVNKPFCGYNAQLGLLSIYGVFNGTITTNTTFAKLNLTLPRSIITIAWGYNSEGYQPIWLNINQNGDIFTTSVNTFTQIFCANMYMV